MVVEFEYAPDWLGQFLWVVIVGFVIAFFLAFGMGSNDCANSYGTVVGAKVLKLWQAYILATIFESLGAGLLGYSVTNTIRSQIVDISLYDTYSRYDNTSMTWNTSDVVCHANNTFNDHNCTMYSAAEFYMGELGALTGTAIWLIGASFLKMPVSATQSVVGALVGFSLVLRGTAGINWITPFSHSILAIVVSWITSPLLAGFFSVSFYLIIKFSVFHQTDQVQSSVRMLPFWFLFTLSVNLFTIFYKGSKFLGLSNVDWWLAIIISVSVASCVALFIWLWGANWMKHRAYALYEKEEGEKETHKDEVKRGGKYQATLTFKHDDLVTDRHKPSSTHSMSSSDPHENTHNNIELSQQSNGNTNDNTQDEHNVVAVGPRWKRMLGAIRRPVPEDPVACKIFDLLQVLSASFLAFSHGSNDTANAVGPLVAIFLSYQSGTADRDETGNAYVEIVIMYGVVCMLIGLWVLGHKVIETVGSDITDVNAPSGFAMTLGTAFTVLFASKIGIPVSTTHCMVGAVVFVGLVRPQSGGVHWKLFGGIAFAWLVTTPVTGAISALVTYLLTHFVLGTV